MWPLDDPLESVPGGQVPTDSCPGFAGVRRLSGPACDVLRTTVPRVAIAARQIGVQPGPACCKSHELCSTVLQRAVANHLAFHPPVCIVMVASRLFSYASNPSSHYQPLSISTCEGSVFTTLR